MSPAVLVLVVVAAFAHATWNLVAKRARTSGTVFLWLTFLLGVVLFAPLGIASLATPGTDFGLLLVLAAGSATLQLAYFLLLQRGYRRGEVSIVYPLARGSGPLLSVVFAIVLFGERPTPIALAGAAAVILGVVVIGLVGSRSSLARNRAGIIAGLLVGVAIASYTLWDANAVVTRGLPPIGYYWTSLVLQLLAFAPFALRHPTAVAGVARRQWGAVLVVGVLAPFAYVLVLFAFTLAPVALVAPAREVSVVLVALGGWLLLKERHPVRRIIGSVIVLAGVALLALG